MRIYKSIQIETQLLNDLVEKSEQTSLTFQEEQQLDSLMEQLENQPSTTELHRQLVMNMPAKQVKLAPKTETKKLLLTQLQENKPVHASFLSQFLFRLAHTRIPAYQAAFAIAICLMVVFYTGQVEPAEGQLGKSAGISAQLADSTDLVDSLAAKSPSKIGRSLKDDSLLSRFMNAVI